MKSNNHKVQIGDVILTLRVNDISSPQAASRLKEIIYSVPKSVRVIYAGTPTPTIDAEGRPTTLFYGMTGNYANFTFVPDDKGLAPIKGLSRNDLYFPES